jgi:hypothetical protein
MDPPENLPPLREGPAPGYDYRLSERATGIWIRGIGAAALQCLSMRYTAVTAEFRRT